MIDEAVANTNDELLEKYINEEPFTKVRCWFYNDSTLME